MHLLAVLFASLLLPLNLLGPGADPASPAALPALQNPGFECGDGYHNEDGIHGMVANGWTGRVLKGDPFMVSTQMWVSSGTRCVLAENRLEKLEGYDSNVFLAAAAAPNEDFVAPPFDVVLYQRAEATPGVEYSLSAWMTSFCGGTSTPSNCPAGAYIAKMAGLDATGGTNPLAATVLWTEDRRPHVEEPWVNLSVANTATTSALTVFLRINSPFWHRGNHAYADAVKLVRAPASRFEKVSARGNQIALSWTGDLGPDIPAIPGTNHKLSFEIQVKQNDGSWQPWLSGQGIGGATFTASPCSNETHRFRIRAWASQPAGVPGSWPNHHFVGTWHEWPEEIRTSPLVVCQPFYIPLISR